MLKQEEREDVEINEMAEGPTSAGSKGLKRTIVALSGPAKQVFKLFALYCKQRGNRRIAEL